MHALGMQAATALSLPHHRTAAAFFSKTLTVDAMKITFEIWDTAGQEVGDLHMTTTCTLRHHHQRYATLVPLYYRSAAVGILLGLLSINSDRIYR